MLTRQTRRELEENHKAFLRALHEIFYGPFVILLKTDLLQIAPLRIRACDSLRTFYLLYSRFYQKCTSFYKHTALLKHQAPTIDDLVLKTPPLLEAFNNMKTATVELMEEMNNVIQAEQKDSTSVSVSFFHSHVHQTEFELNDQGYRQLYDALTSLIDNLSLIVKYVEDVNSALE